MTPSQEIRALQIFKCVGYDFYDMLRAEPTTAARLAPTVGESTIAPTTRFSYMHTVMKTGSETVEATIRRRRIFARFVARMEDTRLPKCIMFVELMEAAGCVGGQEKEWMGCFLDDLRAFGISVGQSTTAPQDEEEWRKTAEQGAKRFMAKWMAA